jgi:hypothetical protein
MRSARLVPVLFLLLGGPGCRSAQLAYDQNQFRARLLDLYTDQIMDNLMRAEQGLPIVQLDFSKITGTITQMGMGSYTGMQTTMNTKMLVIPSVVRTLTHQFTNAATLNPSASQMNQLTVTADPVLNNNEVYQAYLDYLDPNKKHPNSELTRLMKTEFEPPAELVLCGLMRRCGHWYYWIPAEYKTDFLQLALVTTVMRGQPLEFPDAFEDTVVAVVPEFVDQTGIVQLAVQLGTKLKNGTGTLTAQINGETQSFHLAIYSRPTQRGSTPATDAKLVAPGLDTDWFTMFYDPIAAGCKVKLLRVNDVHELDKKGKNLVIVAEVIKGMSRTFHFRVFDTDGAMVVDKDENAPGVSVLEELKRRFPVLFPLHAFTPDQVKEIVFDVRMSLGGSIPGFLGIAPVEFARQLINQPNGQKVKVALDFYKPTVPNVAQALKSLDNNAQLIRLNQSAGR